MTKNFKLEEFTYSRIAVENGLENIPGIQATKAIKSLAINLLQPLRDKLDEPIAITSGYRNSTVNVLVGGVHNSQHIKGEAADCYCAGGAKKMLEVLLQSGLQFDQAILYRKRLFLHLSYREGFNRKEVLYK